MCFTVQANDVLGATLSLPSSLSLHNVYLDSDNGFIYVSLYTKADKNAVIF